MRELVLSVSLKIKDRSNATSHTGQKLCRSLTTGGGGKIVCGENYSGKEMVKGLEQGELKTGSPMVVCIQTPGVVCGSVLATTAFLCESSTRRWKT